MPSAKPLLCAGLAGVCLAGCGVAAKPMAGTPQASATAQRQVDDPRGPHVACLRADHVTVIPITIGGRPGLQIGSPQSGPRVVFEPTPGMAQGVAINGQAQSAEVIGSALVFPGLSNSDALLTEVESCMAVGVKG